ncbi:MAG: hypothetical protein ACW990_02300 [Promethearchaeota archaeon]|jgi:hypothetical protein
MMPLVVSHYTVETPYEKEKDHLVESLRKFELIYEIQGIKSLGTWRANSNFCAKQVLDALQRHKCPVLRVDCDAIFQKFPKDLEDLDCDVAGVIWKNSKLRPEGELLGGTLLFNNTKKGIDIAKEWVLRCKMNPRARNSDILQRILLHRKQEVKFKELSLSYCTIFDSMKNEVKEPVIVHYQASRRFKKIINTKNEDKAIYFKGLQNHVNSDTCVFLGSGISINQITASQWEKIKQFDIWTVNNWIYHPDIVPDFYHIECKHYNYLILKERFKQKWKYYRGTKFIFPKDKTIRMPDKSKNKLYNVVPPYALKFCYLMQYRDRARRSAIFDANYRISPDLLTKSYDMSVTLVMELIYRLKYSRIIIYGMDLKDSYYFWSSGDSKYGKVHHLTNKAHENKDPKLPHGTHKIVGFMDDLNKRWMLPHKKQIFVGYKDTLLYPKIDYIDIESLK